MLRNLKVANRYAGKVKACILDWSGTTADKYVIAPAIVFFEVFKKHGVDISMEEAREPMGLRKDLHIKKITEIPAVRERWSGVYGREPNQEDVDNMFKDFVPMQLDCLTKYTDLIPGTAETVQLLRKDYGIVFGSTTGFIKCMVDVLLSEAKKQGYEPEASVAGDEVEHGARPKPFMVYRNLDLLDISPIQSVVKVDDTVSGIGEAINAGCWGVGVARYSNYMKINTLEEEATLSADEMQSRLEFSREKLRQSGAHYVIDSIVELPEVITDINDRLNTGEKP